jgi:hypothetical protein
MLGAILALSGVLAFSSWQILTVGSLECAVSVIAPSDSDVHHMELWETCGRRNLLIDDYIPCAPGSTVSKLVSVQEGAQTFKVRAVDSLGNKSAFSPPSVPVRGAYIKNQFYVLKKG